MATQNYKRRRINIPLTERKRTGVLRNLAVTKLLPTDHSKKMAEEEIKTIKQQMEFILGVTKTGLDIIDSEFNIRYINTEWANKVYGDPTGKKCFEYFKNRSEVCPNCGIPKALKTKTITVTEGILAKEGNRPIQVTTIPFKNSNGEWLVAEVNVDISERKRIEEGLRKAQDELEIRIQGRTVELTHANEGMLVEIIERKRAEEALKKSEETAKQIARENAVMAEIGRIINSTLNIEEVYERFAEKVREIIPFDRISISTINLEDYTTKIAYVFGLEVPDRNQGDVIPLTDLFEKILTKQSSILIQTDDENEFAEHYPVLLNTFRTGIRSMILTPLISKDKAIGILHLRSTKSNAYSERDLKLVERVGNQIAGAITNAQLFIKHKQAEQALRSERDKLKGILSALSDGLDIVNKDHFIEFQNELLQEQFGDRHGEKCYAAYMGLESPCDLCSIQEAIRTGHPARIELVAPNGRNYELTSSPFMDVDGEIKVIELVRDITERKQIEETLRKSEAKAKRLAQENAIKAEIGRIISSSLNIDEVYERFSEEVRKLIPFDRSSINLINPKDNTVTFAYVIGVDIPGRRAGDTLPLIGSASGECFRTRSSLFIKTENKDEMISRFPTLSATLQTGHSMIIVSLISKDQVIGSLFLGAIKENAYTDQDLKLAESIGDQIAGAVANAQLFAEHKKAEEALKKSEERFRDLFDDAPIGYHEFYSGGRINRVNRTELEMLGYTEEEMLGRYAWDFIVEEVSPELVREKLDSAKLQSGRIIERTFRRKDGTTFLALIHERFFRDNEGQITSIRSAIQDITERKRTEEQMNHLQEQLRQSQKMEAIGRLAGGIAHDFNNLLTIIKGYSQLSLFDLKENDPLRENIQEIQSATQRATNLTRQLLAFSRRQILDPKVLDLNYLLKDLEKMLQRIIGEEIELVTLFVDDLGRVKIDPGELEQIILNLAVNAKDAMPLGGKLTIETTNVELDEEYANTHIGVIPGRYVMLSITDTGVGMPKEVLEKVFEPFFTTKEKGTGLGLSTVYGIVNQSGGTIWVDSELGHGTTFKIYLLRVEEELDILQMRVETDTLPIGSETVLLVEDDQSVRSLAYHILHRQGYAILEATDGEKALHLAQEHAGEKIHLLFTDVVMPLMNGKELADRLKLLRPDIKVLYTSGYTDNAIVHHGVLEPGTHILHKPFSPKSLSNKVREVLDR